jgi:hypothetical protein
MSTAGMIASKPYPNTAGYRPKHSSVFSWITAKLVVSRARKAELRHIAYLRQLDAHLLSDMGIDAAALWQSTFRLRRVNPHVIAAGLIARRASAAEIL